MYTKELVFKGKRRKIHIHQRAFKVFVRDPFAQYWCIDFGLLRVRVHVGYSRGVVVSRGFVTLKAMKPRIESHEGETKSFGDGANTVLEGTVGNTELSDYSGSSPSSGERMQ